MKRMTIGTLSRMALPALLLLGCGPAVENGFEPPLEELGQRSQGIIDSSGLYPLGPLSRPNSPYASTAALSDPNLSTTQLAGEPLTQVGMRADLVLLDSAHWRLQKNAQRGELFLRPREELWVPPVPQMVDPEQLKLSATDRIARLGIPASERAPALQHRILRRGLGEQAGTVQAHMTTFQRAFNGIPVRGSRATVLHNAAGAFHSLRVHWREIAPDVPGSLVNQWSTSMSVQAIVERATARLAELGLSDRNARLRYQYVPIDEYRPDGKTAFALKCTAFVDGIDDTREEGLDTDRARPVAIDIDLDP